MTAPIYGVSAPNDVTVGAAATVSALSVLAGASFGLQLLGFDLGFQSVTATDVPVLVELCKWDGAVPGTPTGAATITQESGQAMAAGFTAFYDYTAEPTALTPFRRFDMSPVGGTVIYDYPLGTEPVVGLGAGFIMRLTTPQAQICRPTFRVQRV